MASPGQLEVHNGTAHKHIVHTNPASTSPAYSAAGLPYADVFKLCHVDRWPSKGDYAKAGSVQLEVDRELGRPVVRLTGAVPGANSLQLPQSRAGSLGLPGQFLYIQAQLAVGKAYAIEVQFVTADKNAHRLCISNLCKQDDVRVSSGGGMQGEWAAVGLAAAQGQLREPTTMAVAGVVGATVPAEPHFILLARPTPVQSRPGWACCRACRSSAVGCMSICRPRMMPGSCWRWTCKRWPSRAASQRLAKSSPSHSAQI
jgi:hypothetical protein